MKLPSESNAVQVEHFTW